MLPPISSNDQPSQVKFGTFYRVVAKPDTPANLEKIKDQFVADQRKTSAKIKDAMLERDILDDRFTGNTSVCLFRENELYGATGTQADNVIREIKQYAEVGSFGAAAGNVFNDIFEGEVRKEGLELADLPRVELPVE